MTSTEAACFDRNGNVGPTVGSDAAAVDERAAALAEWLGDARITPRFRTPLEQELTGSKR